MNWRDRSPKDVYWLSGILALAAALRFHGLYWDEGQGLHPDERFMMMVTAGLRWPGFGQFFDALHSGLNPNNNGNGFFVYGTFPVFLVRLLWESAQRFAHYDLYQVGRTVTALFDIGTVGLCFAIGRLLLGSTAARFVSLLYALAVVPTQLSHFYTVDPFGTFFVMLALYTAMRISDVDAGRSFERHVLAFGLAVGLGTASKLSIAPIAFALPFALWLRAKNQGKTGPELALRCLIPSFYGACMALLAFRTAQPYAFLGPGFFGLRFNPKWIANMEELERLSRPTVGFPPNVQWMQRAPWFPLQQIFFWGLGPIATIGGIAGAAFLIRRHAVRRRWGRSALLWMFVAINYTFFGALPGTKYLRYQLPIYGCLLLLFAYAIASIARSKKLRKRFALTRHIAWAVPTFAVLFASLWALAFQSIYEHPVTRVEASRWILHHWPAPMNLLVERNGTVEMDPMPLRDAPSSQSAAHIRTSGTLRGLSFGHISRLATPPPPLSIPESGKGRRSVASIPALPKTLTIAATVRRRSGTNNVLQAELALDEISARLGETKVSFPPTPLEAGDILDVRLGPPEVVAQLRFEGMRLAHETSWDDTLPLRVDGYDPFGGLYDGNSKLELYFFEGPEGEMKKRRILEALVKSDALPITSNRQYGTLTRLPVLYPIVDRFYRALLHCPSPRSIAECYRTAKEGSQGALGFLLEKTFERSPQLFGITFPDQLAEEAFTVYDHPRVLLFRKTAAFDAANARALLDGELP